MGLFSRAPKSRSAAVITPLSRGLAGLRLQGDARLPRAEARPRVAGYARHTDTPPSSQNLLRLAQEIGARDAHISALLGMPYYQSLLIEAPNVPDDELRGAIRWQIKELINFHVDDAVFDHVPAPGGGGRPPGLYVVVAQSAAVRELAQPFHEAGLPLAAIDVRESAQHNIAARLAPADYGVAVLHVGGDAGLLTFSFGHDLIFSRRIDLHGVEGDALRERVALETQRSVDYFERQYAWFPLARLYLSPDSGNAPLRAMLSDYLPIGVEVIELAELFVLDGAPALNDAAEQHIAFHLLGAALREPD